MTLLHFSLVHVSTELIERAEIEVRVIYFGRLSYHHPCTTVLTATRLPERYHLV